jgi:hypothetical protein
MKLRFSIILKRNTGVCVFVCVCVCGCGCGCVGVRVGACVVLLKLPFLISRTPPFLRPPACTPLCCCGYACAHRMTLDMFSPAAGLNKTVVAYIYMQEMCKLESKFIGHYP